MDKILKNGFPFDSKFIEVFGSKVHYIDEELKSKSSDKVFVLIHGNPSSNYLWRKIIPQLTKFGRVIAPDLIGFGKSDKPNIDYKVVTHSIYFDEFINKLDLKNIVLIMHDWGAALGLAYARRYSQNVKGVAFMEGVIKPKTWDFGSFATRLLFRAFRTPLIGKLLIIKQNVFVENILLGIGKRYELTDTEKEYYRKPFLKEKDRYPVYVFPNEIPINKKPTDVYNLVNKNHEWLKVTNTPKLLLWIESGFFMKEKQVLKMKTEYPFLKVEQLDKGSEKTRKEYHYIQEDYPNEISQSIIEWSLSNS